MFYLIYEDMVEIPLMMKILFTHDSEVKDCSFSLVLLPALNTACSSTIISSAWGWGREVEPVQGDFKHDCTRTIDEMGDSVVLAELFLPFWGV